MSRVVSKNLFNFKLNGIVDDEVLAYEAATKKLYEAPWGQRVSYRMKELLCKDDDESRKEYIEIVRGAMDHLVQNMGQHPTLLKAGADVVTTVFTVPTSHDGDFAVPVEVYTPKGLLDSDVNAAYIYAHGGGVISPSGIDCKSSLQIYAVKFNAVVFNVDYRLAPETKCPNNVKDFYESIKYISNNAYSLRVDSKKIAIGGDSGGGYICLGAMVLLAQHEEAHLIKLAIPSIPMVDDYCFSDPASMTVEEREVVFHMRKIYKTLIAADFDAQMSDPLLFPGKVSDELLQKFPPTIISEVEFDMFITEATRLASRIRRAGRLLELIVIPGAHHMSIHMPGTQSNRVWSDAIKTAIDEYLHK